MRPAQLSAGKAYIFTAHAALIRLDAACRRGTLLQMARLLQAPARNKSGLSWGSGAPRNIVRGRKLPFQPNRRLALLPASAWRRASARSQREEPKGRTEPAGNTHLEHA